MALKLASIVLGATLAGMSSTAVAQEIAERKTEPIINIGASVEVSNRGCYVSDIPLSVRSVPKHREDTYVKSQAPPIRDQKLGCPIGRLDMKSEFGVRRQSGNTEISIGANIGWHLVSEATSGSATARSNYTNAPGTDTRGYGAALTFEGPIYFFNINDLYYGGFVQMAKGTESQFFMRGELDFGRQNILTGWDRYDKLQAHQSYTLANTTTPSFSAGWQNRSSGLTTRVYGKVSYDSFKKTDLGELTTLESRPRLGVGLDLLFGK